MAAILTTGLLIWQQTFESMRNDENYSMYYEATVKKAKHFKFIEVPALLRKRKQPNYSILEYVDGSESSGHHPSTGKEHFRKIYFEAIDTMINALNDRFEQASFEAFSTLESMLLKALKGEEHGSEIAWLESRYRDDLNMTHWRRNLEFLKLCLVVNTFPISMIPNIIIIQLLLVNA